MPHETITTLPPDPQEGYSVEERGPDEGGTITQTPFTGQDLMPESGKSDDQESEATPPRVGHIPDFEAARQIDDPLERLQKLHELDDTNKALLREQLTEKAELMSHTYAHNPALAEQYRSVARGIYWVYAGQPGEPLPDCFAPRLDDDKRVIDITVRPDINYKVVDIFKPITGQLTNDMVYDDKLLKERQDAIKEVIARAPGTVLLEEARHPQAPGERPLTSFEEQVRRTGIVSDVLSDYRMSQRDLNLRDSRSIAARRDIARGMRLLEDERVRTRGEAQDSDPIENARAVIGREVIRTEREAHPATYVTDEGGRIFRTAQGGLTWSRGKLGDSDHRLVLLNTALNTLAIDLNGGQPSDPANKLFINEVNRIFLNDAGDEELDDLVSRQAASVDRDISTVLGGYIPAHNAHNLGLATVAWMRQTKINADPELVAKYKDAPDLLEVELAAQRADGPISEQFLDDHEAADEAQPLVDRETFAELSNTEVGALEIDLRRTKEKPPLQLVMAQRVDSLPELPESHVSPVLRIRLAPGVLGDDKTTIPYLPGYRLAAMRQGEQHGDAITYDFVRDTEGSPYGKCDVPVGEAELAAMADRSRTDGMTAIADKLQPGKVRTVGKIIDAIRKNSHYYLPSWNDGPQPAYIDEGKIYGQCTTFADTTRHLLDGAIDGAKLEPITGLTIPADGRTISAMSHEQVKLTVGDKSYILDATPASEMAEQARKLTMRERYHRVRDGVSRALRRASIVDHDLPIMGQHAIRPTSESSEVSEVSATPEAPAADGPIIPLVQVERAPVDPLERAIASFGDMKSAYEKQLATTAGIDIRNGDTSQLYEYMVNTRGRDGDPYGLVLQRLAVADPTSDFWPKPAELSDEELATRITELDRDMQYMDNLGRDPVAGRDIIGYEISRNITDNLRNTLHDLQRSYQVIAASRATSRASEAGTGTTTHTDDAQTEQLRTVA